MIGYDGETGQIDLEALKHAINDDTAAIYFENPGYLGAIETRGNEISQIAHEYGAICVVSANPISLGVLAPPVTYGADIVCGDIQPLGMHMQFGGGHGGFIASRDEEAYVMAKLRGWDAQWGAPDYEPQPYRNQIRQVGVDGEGRVWALRGTREDPTFDIFDSETGDFLFTAVLPDIGYEGLFWNFTVDDGGILAYSENPADFPQIYVVELQ